MLKIRGKKTETDIAKSDTSSGKKKKVKTALQYSPVNVYKASLTEGPTAGQERGVQGGPETSSQLPCRLCRKEQECPQ